MTCRRLTKKSQVVRVLLKGSYTSLSSECISRFNTSQSMPPISNILHRDYLSLLSDCLIPFSLPPHIRKNNDALKLCHSH